MAFEKILVATDFSIHGQEAVQNAIALAKTFDSSLHIVHAYYFDVPPAYIAGEAGAYFNPKDILDPIRERAQESMEQLVGEISSKGIEVDGRVVLGHASEVILKEVQRLPADVVVMGTRGLTGLKHVLLGSTAERVVRMAPCPVLTVKADENETID